MPTVTAVAPTITTHEDLLTTLDALAWRIDAVGIRSVELDIRRTVATFRSLGLSSVLIGVLADRGDTDVARERAFGMLVVRAAAVVRAPRPVAAAI
jgi:hypothetical protein